MTVFHQIETTFRNDCNITRPAGSCNLIILSTNFAQYKYLIRQIGKSLVMTVFHQIKKCFRNDCVGGTQSFLNLREHSLF